MTPQEKRDGAIALGELHVAYMALDAALERLNTPLAEPFVPRTAITELMEARQAVARLQQGLHMVLSVGTLP